MGTWKNQALASCSPNFSQVCKRPWNRFVNPWTPTVSITTEEGPGERKLHLPLTFSQNFKNNSQKKKRKLCINSQKRGFYSSFPEGRLLLWRWNFLIKTTLLKSGRPWEGKKKRRLRAWILWEKRWLLVARAPRTFTPCVDTHYITFFVCVWDSHNCAHNPCVCSVGIYLEKMLRKRSDLRLSQLVIALFSMHLLSFFFISLTIDEWVLDVVLVLAVRKFVAPVASFLFYYFFYLPLFYRHYQLWRCFVEEPAQVSSHSSSSFWHEAYGCWSWFYGAENSGTLTQPFSI